MLVNGVLGKNVQVVIVFTTKCNMLMKAEITTRNSCTYRRFMLPRGDLEVCVQVVIIFTMKGERLFTF